MITEAEPGGCGLKPRKADSLQKLKEAREVSPLETLEPLWPHLHFDFRLPAPELWDKTFRGYKPPSLYFFLLITITGN